MIIYTGYVYLWYDTKAKLFYLGGHLGKINDSYICSSKPMLRAYKLRPETFKFKVLEYTFGDAKDLRKIEQKWLNMIKNHELMTSENVQNKTIRYYNVKLYASGGNGSANKGKPKTYSWSRGLTKADDPRLSKEGVKGRPKSKNRVIKSCIHCALSFEAKNVKQTFCSKSCVSTNRHKKKRRDSVSKFPPDSLRCESVNDFLI